jgi:hypothetical protein
MLPLKNHNQETKKSLFYIQINRIKEKYVYYLFLRGIVITSKNIKYLIEIWISDQNIESKYESDLFNIWISDIKVNIWISDIKI